MTGPVVVIGSLGRSMINFRGPLLKAIVTRGYRVIALAPGLEDHGSERSALAGWKVDARGIALQRTGLNPLADLRSLSSIGRILRAERPQAVLSYTAKPVIFGTLAAARARVPRRYALITGLGYAFTPGAGRRRSLVRAITMRLYRLALRRTHKVFFQNADDAAMFKELGLIPQALPVVIVNGSGVDLNQFRPAPMPAGAPKFLLIARLLSAKGIREYCSAAAIVRRSHPGAEFHLVGGLDTNPDCLSEEEIRRWEADGIIVWHGEVADVRPFIANCHVYVLPSYREGTPRSVLEAMAMSRPIITTDAPGCRETVIAGFNGFLVPPRSVAPLAEAMASFLDEPGLVVEMGRRSRELAERKYDVDKVNAQMIREMELD